MSDNRIDEPRQVLCNIARAAFDAVGSLLERDQLFAQAPAEA
jgi:hypothetical protein